MASSIEQQAVATKEVVGTMDSLLEGSREISSSSAEFAVSAEQMSRMSQYLLQIMGRFRIPVFPEVPSDQLPERTLAANVHRPARALARQ